MMPGRIMLLLGIAISAGCIMVPAPHEVHEDSRNMDFISAGRELAPGVTTRRDLVFMLGEPDEISENERHLVYIYQATTGYWAAGLPPYGPAGGGSIKTKQRYTALFNAAGVLISFSKDFATEIPDSTSSAKPVSEGMIYRGESVLLSLDAIFHSNLPEYEKSTWKPYRKVKEKGWRGRLIATSNNLYFQVLDDTGSNRFQWMYPIILIDQVWVEKVDTGRWFGQVVLVRQKDGYLQALDPLKNEDAEKIRAHISSRIMTR